MSRSAGENLNLDDILQAGLNHIRHAMDADAGVLCLVDLDKAEHSAACSFGLSAKTEERIRHAKLADDPIAHRAVESGQPVTIAEVFDDQLVRESAQFDGIRSGITVPLASAGEVKGIVFVGWRSKRQIWRGDREFLMSIGRQLGMAIRNAALYEDSVSQNRDLSAVLSVSEAVTASIELDEVVARVLATITGVTSADAAELWLSEGEELTLLCHRGPHERAFLERTRFRVGEGLIGAAAASREAVLARNLAADPRFLRQAVVDDGFRMFSALPVRYHERLMGVLAIAAFSEQAFGAASERRLLAAIGDQIGPAIENARLHRQVQDEAVLEERERIARELHDGMGQVLGYVNTQSLAARKLIADERSEDAAQELSRLEDAARTLYAEVREGILGLRTGPQSADGPVGALREYAERYHEMFGIEASLEVAPGAERLRLAAPAEIQLVRIVQEVLSNVRRHAHAQNVRILFESVDDRLRVTVQDDGVGFDPAHLPAVARPRFGLQIMTERADSVGGTFSVESAPSGTRVMVCLPASAE